MKKLSCTLLMALAACLMANPMPDAAAKAYLKKLSASSAKYRNRSGATRFFSRAQLKYGLERSDYLRRWCDRPLMQDTGYASSGQFSQSEGVFSTQGFINRQSYIAESNLLKRFDFTGFAFFPELSGRTDIYNHTGTPGSGDIKLLPEYFYMYGQPAVSRDLERMMSVAEQALKSPHSFRINGKVVITSYPEVRDWTFWKVLKKSLLDKFGDKFILMPWAVIDYKLRPSGKNRTYTVADIKKMEERVRTALRTVDGFYYNTPPFNNRRYHWEFDREVIIPILHSVMNEPEFQNKYLGWGVKVGHMNCHQQPFAVEAYGTDTLRGTVEAGLLAKADFINCVEWDEENENTCFRPLTTTGFSTLRLCRAFAQQANGGKFTVLDGDDITIPNLVLSYPRVVAAGQALEFEVANIPDGSSKGKVDVQLSLLDNGGKEVWKSAPGRIGTDRINAILFTLPGTKVLQSRFLNPAITVNGKRFDSGFHPIEIRAWWHWDYLWAKNVLRDMPLGVKGSVKLSPPDKHGLHTAEISVDSPEPLRSVELISGDNLVVYSVSADSRKDFRETPETAGFRLSIQASAKSNLVLDGSIKILNASGVAVDNLPSPYGGTETHWTLSDRKQTIRPLHRFFQMPRSEAEKAVVEINLPGLAQKHQIKLSDVLKYGSAGVAGEYSSNLVIAVNNLQLSMPEVLNKKQVKVKVPVRPDSEDSGYFLQAVDSKYRIYRSPKVSVATKSGKLGRINVFSVGENKPDTAVCDKVFLKSAVYDFSGKRGSVVECSLGRRYDGILCGFVPLTTGFGQGENVYGNGMHPYLSRYKAEQYRDTLPVREGNALVFKGGQYVSLPLGMIPPFAGYEIEMDVYVEKNGTPVQTLLTDSRDAFTLQLHNNVPVAMVYLNQLTETPGAQPLVQARGPRLKPWKWNRIIVKCDQKTLQVCVNGIWGKAVPAAGYHRYPRATTVGASERGEFFTGKISSLKITPF